MSTSLVWIGCTGDDPAPVTGSTSGDLPQSSSGTSGTTGTSSGGSSSGTSGTSGTSGGPADAGSDAKPVITFCTTADAGFCDDFDRTTWSPQWTPRGAAVVIVPEPNAQSKPNVLEVVGGGAASEVTAQLERDETVSGKAKWSFGAMFRVTESSIGAAVPRARVLELQVSQSTEGAQPKSVVRVEVDTKERKLYCYGEGVDYLNNSVEYVPGTWYPVGIRIEQFDTTSLFGFCSINGNEASLSMGFQKMLPESNAFLGLHTFANQTPLKVQFDNVVWRSL